MQAARSGWTGLTQSRAGTTTSTCRSSRRFGSTDLLANFPNRTEADLYLWIAFHREDLAKRFELAPLTPDAAVRTFAQVHSDKLLQQAIKTVTLGLRRTFGELERPLGMTEEEFEEAKARHAAGERTIGEAEAERSAQGSEDAGDQDGPWRRGRC